MREFYSSGKEQVQSAQFLKLIQNMMFYQYTVTNHIHVHHVHIVYLYVHIILQQSDLIT